MNDDSWLLLTETDPAFQLPDELRRRDAFGARDCGWVEQMRPFIRQFSSPGDLALDPFCGFGTTLVAAHLEGRVGVGIEVDASRVEIARERLARLQIHDQKIMHGTLKALAPSLPPVQLIVTSLPYFGCRWPGQGQWAPQLYDATTYAQFLEDVRQSFVVMKSILSDNGFLIVMAENLRLGDHFVPLAWDVARLLMERFVVYEERVLVYQRPSQRLEPLATLSNRSHEYALIARNAAKPIDLEDTLECLKALARDHSDFVIFGSFAAWLRGQKMLRLPSDADLLVPSKPQQLSAFVEWFEERGFRITRWGEPLHSGLVEAAQYRAYYFRAERLRADGRQCLIDCCFEDDQNRFEREYASAESIAGLKVVANY